MTTISALNGTAASTATAAPASTGTLGQKDFLTLLTAQLKNQDPLKPMDNAEFLSQMAQFSTVAGIDRVNDTLSAQSGGSRDMRISMAANLLGHSVLVPGAIAYPDETGAVRGAVELARPVESLVVTYLDAKSGAILNSQSLGAQGAGLTGFEWPDLPADIRDARRAVRVTLSAVENGTSVTLDPQVYARVLSARAGAASADVTLDVEGFGKLDSLEIASFR